MAGDVDEVVGAVLDLGVQQDLARLVGPLELVHVAEATTFALGSLDLLGEVEGADDHVLRRRDERTAVGR